MKSLLFLVVSAFVVGALNMSQQPLFVRYNDFGTNELIVTLLIILFSIFHFSLIKADKRFSHVFRPLLSAYCLRVLLIYVDLYLRKSIHIPNSGSDSEHFFAVCKYIASGGSSNYMFFTTCMGEFYKMNGVSRLFSQFLLMMCSMVTLYSVVLIFNKLNIKKEIQEKTILVVGLLPNFAILSSIFLRESLVTMFISLSVLGIIYWIVEKKEYYFFLALIPAFFATAFHTGALAVFAGEIAVHIFYNKNTERIQFSMKNVLPALLAIFLSAYICQKNADTMLAKVDDIQSIEDISDNTERGDSSYAKYVGGSSGGISSLAIYSLPRMFYFSFSPLPWQWRGGPDIIAFVFSSMFYFYVLILSFKHVLNSEKTKKYIGKKGFYILFSLLILAILCSFIFAWGTNNTGTATRHRDKMMCIYTVLLALTFSINENKKRLI